MFPVDQPVPVPLPDPQQHILAAVGDQQAEHRQLAVPDRLRQCPTAGPGPGAQGPGRPGSQERGDAGATVQVLGTQGREGGTGGSAGGYAQGRHSDLSCYVHAGL